MNVIFHPYNVIRTYVCTYTNAYEHIRTYVCMYASSIILVTSYSKFCFFTFIQLQWYVYTYQYVCYTLHHNP